MIVSTMTVKEIHEEVFKDLRTFKFKMLDFRRDFKDLVLQSRRYPLTKSYEWVTSGKKNLFIVDFTAQKRSDWDKPILSIYGMYNRQDGKYAFSATIDKNILSIYPPHFFSRYRERILKDNDISNDELIKHYFRNDWGFMAVRVNANYDEIYHDFENDRSDEAVGFVAATSQGYCFGEKQGDVNVIKTIISEDMLFDAQKQVFKNLRTAFNESNKNRYG